MPLNFSRTAAKCVPHCMPAALAAAVLLAIAPIGLPTAMAATADKVENSRLDSQLFYQVLIGEIELRSGQAGAAYEVMLDAARRSKDEQLFRRATDIALQARAGEQALTAARAWRTALPESQEAHRYILQLLVNLNRVGEALEPMRSLLKITPPAQRVVLINTLPRFLGRSTERARAAAILEQALQPYLDAPDTRVAVNVALGRGWLAAQEADKALEFARRAHGLDPQAESAALLAIEMLPGTASAEDIVVGHLAAKPDSNGVRLVYVRTLTTSQRFADAIALLEIATRNEPRLAPPWLTLGALHLELRHPVEATAALKTFVGLVEANPDGRPAAAPEGGEDEDESSGGGDRGLTQAWLLLAQAAEQQKDFAAAEVWLGKIDNPQRALEVQSRRASLLARQGKVGQARELIRSLPEKGPQEQRAKLMAEAQLLREVKQWDAANTLLADANQRFQNDVDLLYEQSMMAEKLNRMDDMERLLRRVIEIKPDHHHAYNALGYSLADRNLRLAEAKSLIQKALSLSPGEPFITDSLGWVEFRMGNRDEALRLLRTAYKARPDPEIAAHLGEVLWVSGQQDEARRVLREGRTRDSNNDVLRETLARLKVDL